MFAMRHKVSGLLVGTVVLVGAAAARCGSLVAQERPRWQSPAAAPVDRSLDPLLEDILQIRRETGSPLLGSFLDRLADEPAASAKKPADGTPSDGNPAGSADRNAAFAEALRDAARETPTRAEPSPSRPPAFEPPPLDSPSSNPMGTASPNDVVATLRAASRALDDRAHDLDARRAYDAAERLRVLARRLRGEARRLEAADSTPSAASAVSPAFSPAPKKKRRR